MDSNELMTMSENPTIKPHHPRHLYQNNENDSNKHTQKNAK
jgi:hypothetical protein